MKKLIIGDFILASFLKLEEEEFLINADIEISPEGEFVKSSNIAIKPVGESKLLTWQPLDVDYLTNIVDKQILLEMKLPYLREAIRAKTILARRGQV